MKRNHVLGYILTVSLALLSAAAFANGDTGLGSVSAIATLPALIYATPPSMSAGPFGFMVGQLGKLGPSAMRRILSDARNGTSVTGGVGPMPDFAKIILNEYKRATVNLHVKVLGAPAIPIDQMVANATTLFGEHGIQILFLVDVHYIDFETPLRRRLSRLVQPIPCVPVIHRQ